MLLMSRARMFGRDKAMHALENPLTIRADESHLKKTRVLEEAVTPRSPTGEDRKPLLLE